MWLTLEITIPNGDTVHYLNFMEVNADLLIKSRKRSAYKAVIEIGPSSELTSKEIHLTCKVKYRREKKTSSARSSDKRN